MATSCTPETPMTNVTVPPLSMTTSAGKRLSRECPDASCPEGGGNGDPRSSLPNSMVADNGDAPEGPPLTARLESAVVGLDGTGLGCAQETARATASGTSAKISFFMWAPLESRACGITNEKSEPRPSVDTRLDSVN